MLFMVQCYELVYLNVVFFSFADAHSMDHVSESLVKTVSLAKSC